MEDAGPSNKEKPSNGAVHLDLNDDDEDDDEMMDVLSFRDFDELTLKNFSKRASTAFFKHYGLISHQINSFNDFIKVGIQNVFDSIGEIIVEPGYDPSKKEDEWRFASLKFGKVTLEHPRFWTGEKFSADSGKEYLELLPRYARLQNMTYSSRMKVQFTKVVYTQELVRSDKFNTGKEKFLDKKRY